MLYISGSYAGKDEEYVNKQLLEKYKSYWPELQDNASHINISFQLVSTNVDIKFVDGNNELITKEFAIAKKKGFSEARDIDFLPDADGHITTIREVEKMSKSKLNVVNPDDIIAKYGADTLRLYEMFLGPLEQSKPWDTHGIEGTYRFLRKFWNLFHTGEESRGGDGGKERTSVSDEAPTKAELKTLHATLKKVTEDIPKMSFNTAVAQFMIGVNELGALKCNKRAVLEPLTIALSPFAPHIAEELWHRMSHGESICMAPWPQWEAQYLEEDSFTYPIGFNGKMRLRLELSLSLDAKAMEAAVLANPEVQQRLEGKTPKKVVVVPKRIVNIVV